MENQFLYPIKEVLSELKLLKQEILISAHSIVALNDSLKQSLQNGHDENDFLPRRIRLRIKEASNLFDALNHDLNVVLKFHFGEEFTPIQASHDIQTLDQLRDFAYKHKQDHSLTFAIDGTLRRLGCALSAVSHN